MPGSENGISVVVCCYNSASRLPKTLEHLARQTLPAGCCAEVIIVDNNSTDGTSKVAEAEWGNLGNPFPLIMEKQPLQGLSYCREKGIKTANFEFVLLCDDDNWLKSNYLSTAFGIMSSDLSIGALGGRGEVVSDIAIPYWFHTYQSEYAVGVQSLDSGNLTNRGYLWGAGLILRKSVIEKFWKAGFTSLLADRKGNQLSSGGDSEYCKWILFAGHKLWYDENLIFQHYLPATRLTKRYYIEQKKGHDQSYLTLKKYELVYGFEKESIWSKTKMIFCTGGAILKNIFSINMAGIERNLIQLSIYSPIIVHTLDPDIKKIRLMHRFARRTKF
ncbi:MAG: glycosyltransferase [Lewinellaceae bacterium]|nr:glycosyltransferase [Lewinellaceae bacterium]